MADDQIIELNCETGPLRCRVLTVMEFQNREYALLHAIDTDTTALMRLVTEGENAIFRAIEDDEEFEQATAYLRELAGQVS